MPGERTTKLLNAISSIATRFTSLAKSLWVTLAAIWRKLDQPERSLLTRLGAVGLMLLCLLLFVGCAAPSSAARPTPHCRVPSAQLLPTPVPPLSDKTGEDLIAEADELRQALGLCNNDKALTLEHLNKQRSSQ